VPGLVLDCSIAVAWCFEDEASSALDALLDRVQADGAMVPELWTLEVTNVLVQAARRGRITPGGIRERLKMMDMLPIGRDEGAVGAVWRDNLIMLAEIERLTIYDATYLELALRRGLALASSDGALRAAGERRGLLVLPV
jgi:predicted nucleic acid-binding protein